MNPLQIFPKHPSAPDTYYIGGGWSPACITAVDKRFTDAELAAEYWAAQGDARAHVTGNPPLRSSRRQALLRAATLDHYDENPA